MRVYQYDCLCACVNLLDRYNETGLCIATSFSLKPLTAFTRLVNQWRTWMSVNDFNCCSSGEGSLITIERCFSFEF